MPDAFEATLAHLTTQHKKFLAELQSGTVNALRKENHRLTKEVSSLKQVLRTSKRGSSAGGGGGGGGGSGLVRANEAGIWSPPLPPWPKSLPDKEFPEKADVVAAFDADEDNKPFAFQSESAGEPITPSVAPRITDRSPSVKRVATPSDAEFRSQQSGKGSVLLPGVVSASLSDYRPSLQRQNSRLSAAEEGRKLMILDDRRRLKERRRIRQLLNLTAMPMTMDTSVKPQDFGKGPTVVQHVSGEDLFSALKGRDTTFSLPLDAVKDVVAFLSDMEGALEFFEGLPEHRIGEVSVIALVELMWTNGVEEDAPKELQSELALVLDALRTPTAAEIIHEVSRGTLELEPMAKKAPARDFMWFLNMVVSIVVCLNFMVMGISVDREPDHIAWVIFEAFCTGTFLFEMFYKLCRFGCRDYFCGDAAGWNIVDMSITCIAALELLLELMTRLSLDMGSGSDVASAAKAAVMLRAMRAIRVVRLVKLVKSPMLKDLANMLVGFVIGIPSLMWVLCMFVLILCMFGLFFRLVFGPIPGEETGTYFALCGMGDDVTDIFDADCPVHLMYGEEFFGTVGVSMFTCFRFMLGDYSTRGGKSIVVAFSQEYGTRFNLVFVAWMIVVIFGIFNIITAIFVDTTVAGLKHNDIKRKYAQQYERAYVKDKLTMLLERISEIIEETGDCDGNLELDEDQFMMLIADSTVTNILQDLDVEVVNLPAMFCTFDGDDSGQVTIQELMEGIMKLRGEPQKTDVIGCWVSTRMLHEKVDDLKTIIYDRVLPMAPPRDSGTGSRPGTSPGSIPTTARKPSFLMG